MKRPAIVLGLLFTLLPASASAAPLLDMEDVRIAIVEAVNTDKENFGGAYLDKDGTLVIQYVGINAGAPAVEAQVDQAVPVRWVRVDRSRAELDKIAAAILDRNFGSVVIIGIDTIENQVKVTVAADKDAMDTVSAISNTYGASARVEVTNNPPVTLACNSRFICSPWRGAIHIENNGASRACTWGFQASRNGNLQMVTAGHCNWAGIAGRFFHNGGMIGQNGVGLNGINPDTYMGVDVSRTKVDGPGFPEAQNLLYATDAFKLWSLTSVISNDQFFVGQGAGKSGRTSNYTFGTITSVHVNYRLVPAAGTSLIYYPDCSQQQLATCPWMIGVQMSTYAAGGDSGSPVYSTVDFNPPMGDKFFGILSASNSQGITLFASAKDTLAALDLDFWCKTPTCP